MMPVDENGIEVSARIYLEGGREGKVRRARFSRTHLMPATSVPWGGRSQGLAARGLAGQFLNGFIRVPRKGIYTFFLSSDDGSRLTVGDRVVVNHDGPHSMAERAGISNLGEGTGFAWSWRAQESPGERCRPTGWPIPRGRLIRGRPAMKPLMP